MNKKELLIMLKGVQDDAELFVVNYRQNRKNGPTTIQLTDVAPTKEGVLLS